MDKKEIDIEKVLSRELIPIKEKEIKTYGDLAEKFLTCCNNICRGLSSLDILDLDKSFKLLKSLVNRYGEKKIGYVKNVIEEISYQIKHLNEYSEYLSNQAFYCGYKRVDLINIKIDKINKLKAELDKEIEECNMQ